MAMQRRSSANTWIRPRVLWSVIASLAAAAAIVWLSQPRRGDDAPASIAVVSAAAREPGAAVAASDEESSAPAATSALPSGSELIEVCGVGWIDADGARGSHAIGSLPDVDASQRALVDSLRRNEGELGAAVAVVADLRGVSRDAAAGVPADAFRCTEPQCAPGSEAHARATDLLEQLAKQATTTQDARVYALALRECAVAPAQGSCALLSSEQWARLDEGNAAPWLHLLARARQDGDAAGVHEALYRIGAAARHEERPFLAAGTIADNAGSRDVDLIAAQLLAADVLVMTPAPYAPLMAVCTSASFADANRRQACDRAAATLAERSDSLSALTIGTALGRRLGWAEERIEALRGLEFARAAMVAEGEVGIDAARDLPQSCGGTRRLLAMLARQGRAGELQPIRDWLAASGKTIAPYARQAHEMLRGRADAAAREAAAAASSAAASAEASVAAPSAVSVAQGGDAIRYSEAPPPAR